MSTHALGFLLSLHLFTHHTPVSSYQVLASASFFPTLQLICSLPKPTSILSIPQSRLYGVPFLLRDKTWAFGGISTGYSHSTSPKQNLTHSTRIHTSSSSYSPFKPVISNPKHFLVQQSLRSAGPSPSSFFLIPTDGASITLLTTAPILRLSSLQSVLWAPKP